MLHIARYSDVVECLEEIKLSALYDMLYIARYSGVVKWLEEITLSALYDMEFFVDPAIVEKNCAKMLNIAR